jgi:hypothetical protein
MGDLVLKVSSRLLEHIDFKNDDVVIDYLTAQALLRLQPVSKKLEHVKIVLFKAMKAEVETEFVIERMRQEYNYVNTIMKENENLKVIKMHDATHMSIMQEEETLVDNIIKNYPGVV